MSMRRISFLSIHFSTDGQASDFVNDTTGKGVPDLIVGSLKSTLGAFGEFDETDQYIVVARETKAPSVILSIPIAQQWATPDGQKTLASDLYNAICQGFGVQAKTDIASTPVQAPVVQAPTVTTLDTTNPPQGGSAIVTAPATSNSVADKLTTDTPATPVQSTPVVASASGVTLVTHSELSNLLAEFSKTAEVSAGLSGVEQYVRDVESKLSGYVKTSDIEQIVLNVLLKALTKTNQ
ncbi:hypothetical protein QB910_000043 [Dabrowskivirus KKP3916]|uniref:Uncharacterized protein n=1 Tax=Alicyclobacillus phage KKP_3916 TaxID=3040651 RepID=A0AAT9V7I2_9CAUD|nr:hypothetical protein QB910_000043 [Alicyclobacillus phage KKP 3916]